MEKIALAVLLLASCAEPPPPAKMPPPAPCAVSTEEHRESARRETEARAAETEAKKALELATLENKMLIGHIDLQKKAETSSVVEVFGGAGAYFLIEYAGKDCGGLPSHIMRIDREDEWRWLGLKCVTKRGDKGAEVGFECQGNNDKITARKTAWNTYEGVESRSPSTVFKGTPLAGTCTGAWGVKATLITHVPRPPRQ